MSSVLEEFNPPENASPSLQNSIKTQKTKSTVQQDTNPAESKKPKSSKTTNNVKPLNPSGIKRKQSPTSPIKNKTYRVLSPNTKKVGNRLPDSEKITAGIINSTRVIQNEEKVEVPEKFFQNSPKNECPLPQFEASLANEIMLNMNKSNSFSLDSKKSSVDILFSRADASTFIRNSQLIEFVEKPECQAYTDCRTAAFESVIENCLKLKLLSHSLYEDCTVLNTILGKRIDDQNGDANMTEIQGWLCLLHESIACLLSAGNNFNPNMDAATEREDKLICHRWESRLPSVLRGLREKFSQVDESANQLMLVYR